MTENNYPPLPKILQRANDFYYCEGLQDAVHTYADTVRAMDAAANPWRTAIDEALVSIGTDCIHPEETAKQALSRLIEWEVKMALDPQISSEAQALQAPLLARIAELESVMDKALRQAWELGQTYWMQSDSDYASQHRKADGTKAKFLALISETRATISNVCDCQEAGVECQQKGMKV